MKQVLLLLLSLLLLLTACGPAPSSGSDDGADTDTTPTKVAVVVTRAPTATNFPLIGTPTAVLNTPTPKPTPTQPPPQRFFDDETLAELMTGTIAATGVEAEVEIVDERAGGGERLAYITLVSEHNIDESDLLLKLFVLEVGSALRTLRAFRDGTTDADIDATFITVNNKAGELMGTVKAPTAAINDFLDGSATVNETLERLELTGVFESFVQ